MDLNGVDLGYVLFLSSGLVWNLFMARHFTLSACFAFLHDVLMMIAILQDLASMFSFEFDFLLCIYNYTRKGKGRWGLWIWRFLCFRFFFGFVYEWSCTIL